MRNICILIARGGSKGIPNKNLVNFCGKPLIFWTLRQAQKSKYIEEVWLSSDSEEILKYGESLGVLPILRPSELASDSSSSEDAWLHALEVVRSKSLYKPDIDYVVVPQATSPLRSPSDFDNAIEKLIKVKGDSLLSVVKVEDFFMWQLGFEGAPEALNYNYQKRNRRQEIQPRYLENGSFYIFKPRILTEDSNRLGGKISLYEMARHKMFQIDEPGDLELCEVIMRGFDLDK